MRYNVNCVKCGSFMELTRIFKQAYCLSCHNEYMRLHRPKHRDLPTDQRLKANCRSYLNVYLNKGKVEKKPCETCGSEKSQAHHDDYNKPLEVRWFCRDHHLEFHGYPQEHF